ncbi:lipocalin family protein [Marinomonas ostreistagni]|uniref:Outer membrane lipoprotein Blc n=1 Tax=Marinomonas ostreistagni TaxID=359209 RepID=A0ABS0ZDI8_9GAMM|nr:lipocalin family protein [Marinomonas ostreistagni]MBJ7551692.1 lipocalin family protein [Marinomonas ostreistagni]
MFRSVWGLLVVLLAGCTSAPKGIEPVQEFELSKYLGTWYEIARLDHSFERGLSNVTAEYSLREDGGVRVINRGYSAEEGKWEQAEGKAYFVEDSDTGHLKVSFFGPFYGAYVVFNLDEDYQQSFVSGPDRSYLWFLSRTPTVSEADKQRFIQAARAKGFETDELIFVEQ